jgi:hypothetical protein
MEDVQYLLQQGTAVEQSFLFVIDSATRDKASYPTPSEYYIPFPMPFRNVFAVDLIDATIPRTEYSIEMGSNVLCYAPGSWARYEDARLAGTLVAVTIQPGDYNTPQLISALNDALNAEALKTSHVPLVVEAVGDPVDITNSIRFVRPEPFVLFMNESTIRNWIGFGNPSTAPGATVAWDGSARFSTDASVVNDVFVAVPSTAASPTLAFAGPVPVELPEYTVTLNTNTTKVRQTFTAASSGLVDSLVVRGTSASTPLRCVIVDTTFETTAVVLEAELDVTPDGWSWVSSSPSSPITLVSASGDGDDPSIISVTTAEAHGLDAGGIITIRDATTLALNGRWVVLSTPGPLEFTFTCSTAVENVVLGKAVMYAPRQLLAGTIYTLELESTDVDVALGVYRAETFASDTANKLESYVDADWATTSEYDALSMDVSVSNVGYHVRAPGQCNLTGERYVLIRSPDVEQHLNRDLAAAYDRMAPGMGMVRFGGLGFHEERFFQYATRKFHPIGKLKGIHIRLETRAGRLYDAHGIDHTLLCSVKMYAPAPSQAIPRDLFPGYTPNAHVALTKKMERERDM